MAEEMGPLTLEVLWFLTHAAEAPTLTEVARGTNCSRATVDRTLQRLCDAGWVLQEGRPKRFRVSLRVALLGIGALNQNRVRQAVLPFARELAEMTQSSVTLAFFDDGCPVFTDTIELRAGHFIHNLVDLQYPAVRTAAGKMFLAYLPYDELMRALREPLPALTPYGSTDAEEVAAEIRLTRERGYATADREANPERAGLAVPILDRSNRAVATLSLSLLPPLEPSTISHLAPMARLIGLQASAALQDRPPGVNLVA